MSRSAGITNQIRSKMRDEARRLSDVSLPRSLAFIASTWAMIILGILLPVLVTYYFTGSGWVLSQLFASSDPVAIASVVASLLVSMLIVAARQHALAILMHDGAHLSLARDRSLNEVVSNWFCAFPLGMVTSLYRRWHLAHHASPNTQSDPDYLQHLADSDFSLPMLRRTLFSLMVKDLSGVNLPKWVSSTTAWLGWSFMFKTSMDNPISVQERCQFIVLWAAIAALAILTGTYAYLIVIWYIPILTLLPAFARIRTLAEHNYEQSSDELDHTRHVEGRPIERFFIAPFNINYHVAHHYFPSVPHCNLPALHRALIAIPEFRQRAIVLSTYFGKRNSVISAIAPPADH